MFEKLLILVFTALALLKGAYSRTATLPIFPGDPDLVSNIQGEIQGTGADGTTFVVSDVFSGRTATVTIVEASNYLSEIAAVSTSGMEDEVIQECGLDAHHAGLCTVIESASAGGRVTVATTIASATFTYAPIPINVGSNSGAASIKLIAVSVFALAPIIGFAVALW